MDGWTTSFLLGRPIFIFSGAMLGRVIDIYSDSVNIYVIVYIYMKCREHIKDNFLNKKWWNATRIGELIWDNYNF